MASSVRKIFLALIGTVVLIVISSAIIELVNIGVNGVQLQQNTKMACQKSLVLFAQESYKQRDPDVLQNLIGGSVNMQDINDETGSTYAYGQFYNGSTVSEIYNDIYTKNDFKEWANSDDIRWTINGKKQTWASIQLLNRKLNLNDFPITSMPEYDYQRDYDDYMKDVDKYTEYLVAENYVNTYMTPLNFGVPYMDKETVNKIFKWNLTRVLTNYQESLIKHVSDNPEDNYIQVHGFRVWANRATVKNIKYKVFNTTDSADVSLNGNGRAAFVQMTNIDPDKLGFSSDLTYLGTDIDERTFICVISVEYEVPISYTGITPLKRIFEYIWNSEVAGWDSINYDDRSYREYDESSNLMTGGGYSPTYSGYLPVPGTLTYYVVR